MREMQHRHRCLYRLTPVSILALLLISQGNRVVALGAEADAKTASAKDATPLPTEIARFEPPMDARQGESPWIYAVSARPMGIPTFPQ
ncbi:MAG: hypothetical protein ACC645_22880, partial [Pirellulales bacterium]